MSEKGGQSDEDNRPDDVVTRDWSKLKQNNSKIGYKVGVIAAREAGVQDAFVKTYQQNSNNAFTTLAKWRGILGAVLCYFDQTGDVGLANREKITKVIEKLLQVQQVLATPEREHLTLLSTLIGQSEEVRSSIANSKESHSHDTSSTPSSSSSTSLSHKNHEKPQYDSEVSPRKDISASSSTDSSQSESGNEQEVSKKKMKLSTDKSASASSPVPEEGPLNLVLEKKPKRNLKLDLPKQQTDDYRMLMMTYEDKTRMLEIQKECKKVVSEVGLDRISHLFDSE